MGAIGWAPDTFWAATPMDLSAAIRGRTGDKRTSESLSEHEYNQLKAMLEADGKSTILD